MATIVDPVWVEYCERGAESVAESIDRIAVRVRVLGARFAKEDRRSSAVSLAMEIVTEVMQQIGNASTHMEGMVNAAQHLDRERRKAQAENPS